MFDLATFHKFDTATNSEFRVAEVIAALSHALDLAEGQPAGHAVRTCLIGMRLAEELQLPSVERSALFYALLLKDIGSSANSSKMCYLLAADDRKLKTDLKNVDWAKLTETFKFVNRNVMPDGSPLQRALRSVVIALEGPRGAARLVEMRCQRGADAARRLGFSDATVTAIWHLDEHWDGRGYPKGFEGEEISLGGRIACLAQTVAALYCADGLPAAADIACERRGTWFDPALVDALLAFMDDFEFWNEVGSPDPGAEIAHLEPEEFIRFADEATLDCIARTFAEVVDAKSPWTFGHSLGVAQIALGIAQVLGLPDESLDRVHRAGLLHDIGKLGVSNLILDKPGNLNSDEYVELRRHPEFTLQILGRSAAFHDIAEMAATHHERLDGRGYHRGIHAVELPVESRLLVVADICEALAAKRPYRDEFPREKVHAILTKDAGTAVCADCVQALKDYHARSELYSRVNDQLDELDRLLQSV
jgi:putative nucleotidyltransferase with HDIG domain